MFTIFTTNFNIFILANILSYITIIFIFRFIYTCYLLLVLCICCAYDFMCNVLTKF